MVGAAHEKSLLLMIVVRAPLPTLQTNS